MCFPGEATPITWAMCFPDGEHIKLMIFSQVGEHIKLLICVSQLRELKSLRICVSQVGEHITLELCVSQVREHKSLAICVSQVGKTNH